MGNKVIQNVVSQIEENAENMLSSATIAAVNAASQHDLTESGTTSSESLSSFHSSVLGSTENIQLESVSNASPKVLSDLNNKDLKRPAVDQSIKRIKKLLPISPSKSAKSPLKETILNKFREKKKSVSLSESSSSSSESSDYVSSSSTSSASMTKVNKNGSDEQADQTLSVGADKTDSAAFDLTNEDEQEIEQNSENEETEDDDDEEDEEDQNSSEEEEDDEEFHKRIQAPKKANGGIEISPKTQVTETLEFEDILRSKARTIIRLRSKTDQFKQKVQEQDKQQKKDGANTSTSSSIGTSCGIATASSGVPLLFQSLSLNTSVQSKTQPKQTSSTLSFNNNNSKFSSDCKMPIRMEYLLDMPETDFETQVLHAWNPDDRSLNIFVKESDPFTLHRHPVAQSTDCIRTKFGYTKGIHLFELNWNSRQRGTHAIIGVSLEKTPLHCVGYQALIGANGESWGWDLGRNRACHNTKATNQPPPVYPRMLKPDEPFVVPDNFFMCLDMDEGTLSFMADGQFLGVAFRGLKGKKVYPIVSAVWGHCEITMKYKNGLDPNPLPLADLCRRTIRQTIGKDRLDKINELKLPNAIKNYLLFKK